VTVIDFGHLDSPDELAAHRLRARSLLDPRLARSLAGLEPGRASPLAHALDLAAHELRRALRDGRIDDEVRLVVFTDGRGNVPLDASLRSRLSTSPVHREGVEDALRTAETMRGLGRTRIRCHLHGPESEQYPRLVANLAAALGAEPSHGGLGDGLSEAGHG